MLTTVLAFSPSEAESRLRWPAWSEAIVGTSPTDWPARRQLATMSRSRAAVATTSGRALATAAVPDPVLDHREAAGIAVRSGREGPRPHFRRLGARPLAH